LLFQHSCLFDSRLGPSPPPTHGPSGYQKRHSSWNDNFWSIKPYFTPMQYITNINTEHGTKYSGFLQHYKHLSARIGFYKTQRCSCIWVFHYVSDNGKYFFAVGKLHFIDRKNKCYFEVWSKWCFLLCQCSCTSEYYELYKISKSMLHPWQYVKLHVKDYGANCVLTVCNCVPSK
jgi:hypothetical protein